MTAAATTVVGTAHLLDRRRLLRRVQTRFGAFMVIANADGAAVVFLFLSFVLPRDQRFDPANVVAVFVYMAFSMVVACVLSTRAFGPIQAMLEARTVTAADRLYVVRHPLRQTVINFSMWVGALLVFVPINAKFGWQSASDVASTVLLGGISTCGLTYLAAERILRPVNAVAFEDGSPVGCYVPGVKSRLLIAWAVGTGIPLIGVLLMGLDRHGRQLSIAGLVFLACAGVVSGTLAILFAAKSIADPIESVRSALAAVEDERLDIKVPVYDGSQIGQLQAGFNSMVEGLRERRRLHDLFGRQVGVDVARQALERGVRLGGETAQAAVLFVDIIGSTELAASRPATEVVRTLNAFFGVVVDVVDRCGGFVNKFEGDAALCVFGAPVPRDDCVACALQAARLLRDRLTDIHGLSAAIGVSAGTVVAGNVGTRERFEYTVIGDAVNEAARLTELAKQRPERLLIAASLLDLVPDEERKHWHPEGATVLRGRNALTRLALPA
ncbi:MAG TPA: adenylate/guanylate cyclase domain-containing protein [Mycobacteriales bacterium]|nr:adenylate/guanylate cyclase domain-containing protein [Mycobacteriales bacterium]